MNIGDVVEVMTDNSVKECWLYNLNVVFVPFSHLFIFMYNYDLKGTHFIKP